ncbi:MAG: aldo/keto reductase [Spirochaetaceae bacterium]|nr:MAG: aldo/keto reductase [Spirochaetaceae bacterium]
MKEKETTKSLGNGSTAPIALGGSYFDPAQFAGEKRDELLQTMQRALELGIDHFDTAAGYAGGESERVLGEFIRTCGARRETVFVATKSAVGEMDAGLMHAEVDHSLKRLGLEYIDLYYIHWPRQGKDPRPLMEGLVDAKRLGKIRAIGVSNFSVEQMAAVREVGPLDAHQMGFNLFWRKPERDIIPYCRENGIAVVTYSSIAQGIMTGKFGRSLEFVDGDPRNSIVFFRDDVWPHVHAAVEKLKTLAAETGRSLVELGIRWVLAQNGVTAAVVGARNERQVRANVAALEGDIPDDVFDRMTEISDRVQPFFPDIPNMYNYLP